MRPSTKRRRSSAPAGFTSGESFDGAFGSPASSAASLSVSFATSRSK